MVDGLQIIKNILKAEKITKTELANRLGTTRQNLNATFNKKDIPLKKFNEILNRLGYECDFKTQKVNYLKVSKDRLNEIIQHKQPNGTYYAEDDDRYIAVDNTFGQAVKQDFKTQEACIAYLKSLK